LSDLARNNFAVCFLASARSAGLLSVGGSLHFVGFGALISRVICGYWRASCYGLLFPVARSLLWCAVSVGLASRPWCTKTSGQLSGIGLLNAIGSLITMVCYLARLAKTSGSLLHLARSLPTVFGQPWHVQGFGLLVHSTRFSLVGLLSFL